MAERPAGALIAGDERRRSWRRLRPLLVILTLLVAGASLPTSGLGATAPRPRAVFFLQGVNTSSADGLFASMEAALKEQGAADGWGDPARTSFHLFSYEYPALQYTCDATWQHPIARLAERFDAQLAAYLATHPDHDVMLIGHSQGGLIAVAYLALLKGSPAAPWREVAPGSSALLTHIITLSAPLGGIPPASAMADALAQTAPGAGCRSVTLDPPNTADMRRLWATADGAHPRGGRASVPRAILPAAFDTGDGGRFDNQRLATDAAWASIRLLTIGNSADPVWAGCGPLAGLTPAHLDTQWLTDQPERAIYGRVVTPTQARPCQGWEDIAAGHTATLTDPAVHRAVLRFLNGGAPDTLAPAPAEFSPGD